MLESLKTVFSVSSKTWLDFEYKADKLPITLLTLQPVNNGKLNRVVELIFSLSVSCAKVLIYTKQPRPCALLFYMRG